MQRRQWLAVILGIGFIALSAASAQAQTMALVDPATGDPKIMSVEAIGFAPGGVLLIGDGKGKQVVAVQTDDTTPVKWTKTEIANIKNELAGRLGATAKDIAITKIAVNTASQTAYVAVRMQAGKKDVLMTIDGSGKIKEFALDNVKFAAVPLPADQKVTSITGVRLGWRSHSGHRPGQRQFCQSLLLDHGSARQSQCLQPASARTPTTLRTSSGRPRRPFVP